MDMALDNIVPETLNWRHTDEGPEWAFQFLGSYHPLSTTHRRSTACSDSYVPLPHCSGQRIIIIRYVRLIRRVSHTKSSLVGSSISIPITGGRLNLGTWQGVADWIFLKTCRRWADLMTSQVSTWLSSDTYLTHARSWLLYCSLAQSNRRTTLISDQSALESKVLWSHISDHGTCSKCGSGTSKG